jgi:hypothetical protein
MSASSSSPAGSLLFTAPVCPFKVLSNCPATGSIQITVLQVERRLCLVSPRRPAGPREPEETNLAVSWTNQPSSHFRSKLARGRQLSWSLIHLPQSRHMCPARICMCQSLTHSLNPVRHSPCLGMKSDMNHVKPSIGCVLTMTAHCQSANAVSPDLI